LLTPILVIESHLLYPDPADGLFSAKVSSAIPNIKSNEAQVPVKIFLV